MIYPQAATLQTGDDRLLMSQIAKKDRAAFEALYRRYYRRVFQFAVRRVWRDELAEEVVSDVMFAVWQNAASFEGASSVSTWLLGITYRQAMKALDRNRKHKVVDSNDELLAETVDSDPSVDPESAAVTESEHAMLQKGLDRLAEHHRVVVELTATGHSYGEIAEIIGCPENTVKTRMFHARLQLKRFLIEAGNTSESFTPEHAPRLSAKLSTQSLSGKRS
jgi:RNA polymerase sigma-70 factor, ECF subfamily